MPERLILAMVVFFLAVRPAGAQQPTPDTADVLVLDRVTLVDVDRGVLIPDQRIVVRGDTIAAVESASAPRVHDATRTVDGSGLFVIPGLVDHHIHLGPGMDSALVRAVRGGVTLVQAMAGDNRVAGNYARAVMAGELKGPEVAYASVMVGPDFATDPRFVAAGLGYGPGESPWAQSVTPEADLAVAVAAARGSGAEVLKLYAMLDAELVRMLTREAHRQGMRVVAHATVFPARPSDVTAAGVDVLTHSPYLSWQGAARIAADDAWDRRDGPYESFDPAGPEMRALARGLAESGAHLEPTLWVFHRSAEDSVIQTWAREATRTAHEAGVPILAGTDGFVPRGAGELPYIHDELTLLVRSGLTPAEALAAATINPARVMGRGNTHGLVAPGRVADLVLLDDDPLADIGNTRSIRHVIRRGHLLSPTQPVSP